jgi:ubiquitin-like modifier-activating enzyme 5
LISLRQLLGFGSVSYYLGYNALQDFFPRDKLKPNDECANKWCVQRSREYKERMKNAPPPEPEKKKEKKVVHEDNEWDILKQMIVGDHLP